METDDTATPELFREEQKFRHWWFWLLIAPAVVLPWYAFFEQIVFRTKFGNNPGPDWLLWIMVVVFGVGFPLLFVKISLTVIVTSEEIRIRYFPLYTGAIKLTDVQIAEIKEYSAVGDWGGWGIRWSPGRGLCYTMIGNHGVSIVLTNGRRRLIGSTRPEELLSAIQRTRKAGSQSYRREIGDSK